MAAFILYGHWSVVVGDFDEFAAGVKAVIVKRAVADFDFIAF